MASHDAEAVKQKVWGGALGAVIVVSALLIGTLLWLFWPYPSVDVVGKGVLANEPADGIYKTGDVIRWTTPVVCQPSGKTVATIYAVLDFTNDDGGVVVSRTPMATRDFRVKNFPECVNDNPTSAYIDGTLATGTYRFEVEACVYNPSPRPKCETFLGPSGVRIKRIAGNEP